MRRLWLFFVFVAFFWGCADIPDELREEAKGNGVSSSSSTFGSSSSVKSSSSGLSLLSSSSLSSGTVLCFLYSGVCLSITAGECSAISGQVVQSCPLSSSSISSSSSGGSSSSALSLSSSSLFSSSSGYSSSFSSSSSSLGTVLCLYSGVCLSIGAGDCTIMGGQQVLSCPLSSSSFSSSSLSLLSSSSSRSSSSSLFSSSSISSSSSSSMSSSSLSLSSSSSIVSVCNGAQYNTLEQGCCVSTLFSLANQRCQSNVIETKCGTNGWYDATNANLRCQSNVVEAKCGTSWYNASDTYLRCQNNVVETKCGTSSWYDATNTDLRCQSNVIETKCGASWYNATNANLRCQSDVVETKCGTSSWYDATNTNLRCQNSVIETKCGTSWYNDTDASLRCNVNVVENKCGIDWYNASTQFCYGTTVYSKCGTATYDPETQRCQSSVVENPCGTSWYNATTQFCYNGAVYSLCGGTATYNPTTQFCDSRDSKAYKRVTIGTQTWMAENLNYSASGSKCYDNSTANCTKYGRLYDWATAMGISSSYNSSSYNPSASTKYRGVCPSGWHLPSNAEWDKLVRYVDGSTGTSSPYDSPTAGRYLKAKSGWNSNGNGEDTYGFSALPGGYGYSDGYFSNVGNYGYWWSSSESSSGNAYSRYMYYNYEDVFCRSYVKDYLFSVRCLQD